MDKERKETLRCCRHRGSSWISSLKHLTLSLIIVGTQLWSVSLVKAGDPENIYAGDMPFSAKCLAKWRAGITDRDPCIRCVTVGNDLTRVGKNYLYEPNQTAWGKIWVYQTPLCEKAIVYHDHDPNQPQASGAHWHAAQGAVKWGSNSKDGIYTQCGGDHHIYEGSAPSPPRPLFPTRPPRGRSRWSPQRIPARCTTLGVPFVQPACDAVGLDPEVGAVAGISATAFAALWEAYIFSGASMTFSEWLYMGGYYAAGTTGGTALIAGCVATIGLGAGGAADYCTGNRISGGAATGMLAAWDTTAVIWRWRFDYTMTQNAAEDCYRGSKKFLLLDLGAVDAPHPQPVRPVRPSGGMPPSRPEP